MANIYKNAFFTGTTTNVTAVCSILEISREDQNG